MGVAWRRGVDFAGCKACTARRRGRSFCAYKRNQNTVKGDRFPLDKPLSGRPAALDTNLFLGYRPKTNPYCTQMGFKGVCDTFLSPLRWSAERRTTTPVWPGSLHSRIAALTLALLVSLPKELSLHPPPAALQFLAPQRRGTMGRESKYFLICGLQGAKPLTHGYG